MVNRVPLMFIEKYHDYWRVVAPLGGRFQVVARFRQRQEAHNFLAGKIVTYSGQRSTRCASLL